MVQDDTKDDRRFGGLSYYFIVDGDAEIASRWTIIGGKRRRGGNGQYSSSDCCDRRSRNNQVDQVEGRNGITFMWRAVRRFPLQLSPAQLTFCRELVELI